MEGFTVKVTNKENPDSSKEFYCDGWFGTAGMITDLLPSLTGQQEGELQASKIEVIYGEVPL